MLGAIMPFLRIQMIMDLFKGGRRSGGFNISKIMNMVMMFTMIPLVLKMIPSGEAAAA